MVAIWVVTVASVLVLVAVHAMYWLDAREVRRDTSRFKMFAVRDRLVWLVASGEIEEDDPAWQMLYTATNCMLDLSYGGTLLGHMLDDARMMHKMVKDPKCQERVEATKDLLLSAARTAPGVAEVLLELQKAIASMRRARTPSWQWWLVIAMVVILAPYIVLQRAVRELFFKNGPTQSATAVAIFSQRAQGSGQNPRFAAA